MGRKSGPPEPDDHRRSKRSIPNGFQCIPVISSSPREDKRHSMSRTLDADSLYVSKNSSLAAIFEVPNLF